MWGRAAAGGCGRPRLQPLLPPLPTHLEAVTERAVRLGVEQERVLAAAKQPGGPHQPLSSSRRGLQLSCWATLQGRVHIEFATPGNAGRLLRRRVPWSNGEGATAHMPTVPLLFHALRAL